jgi:hypothetical protein
MVFTFFYFVVIELCKVISLNCYHENTSAFIKEFTEAASALINKFLKTVGNFMKKTCKRLEIVNGSSLQKLVKGTSGFRKLLCDCITDF